MTCQALDFLAFRDVPEADRFVFAARRQQLAVVREGQCIDSALVPEELHRFLAGGDVPQSDVAVLAGSQDLSVWGNGKRETHEIRALATTEQPRRGNVPHLHRAVEMPAGKQRLAVRRECNPVQRTFPMLQLV